jgi:hypothetical protein
MWNRLPWQIDYGTVLASANAAVTGCLMLENSPCKLLPMGCLGGFSFLDAFPSGTLATYRPTDPTQPLRPTGLPHRAFSSSSRRRPAELF